LSEVCVDGPRAVIKQLRLTLIRRGGAELAAVVTLTPTLTTRGKLWMGVACVEIDGMTVKHGTVGHETERDALRELTAWMQSRCEASSTRLETGSRVTLAPRVATDRAVLSSVVSSLLAEHLDPTILIVDDDERVRLVIRRMLRDTRWRILDAGSALEALAQCEEHRDRIALVLLDVVMPDLDGCLLFARMRETIPALRAIYMSGYGVEILAKYGAAGDETSFLQKPFTSAALRVQLSSALDAADRPAA
jgi:CheY-like chemotaxis protein